MKEQIRSALLQNYSEPVRDSLWGHIYLTRELSSIIESSSFMRLHRIMQLGPTLRVYPGATHTRASHSIGVYHLARRLIIHLAEEGADEWLTVEGVKSFLCAALLHDLGHFPYTHSLKELPLKEHEALTGDLILTEEMKSLVGKAGADPYFTAAIVAEDRSSEPHGELLFYRKLLSGSLDPDKLDYLSRDARYCGVPYGAQDVDFILSRLHPNKERGADIDSRGISGIESLLFSKYLMYRAVYWHKTVRAATAMVKKAILGGLKSQSFSPDELYNLDDQGLFAISGRLSSSLKNLVDSVRNGRLYSAVIEIPFDENAHRELSDLTLRAEAEAGIAEELGSKDSIIIDIPENISFESGLFVRDENLLFSESTSAFKKDLIDRFVKSLRIVRVFIEPGFEREYPALHEKILQICKKWLKL